MLNRPPTTDPPDIPDTPFLNLAVDITVLSGGEVLNAAKKLKSGKSTGEDRTAAEMIKCSVAVCITVRAKFFSIIRRTKEIPKGWTKSTLVKMFKKDNASKFENWRGISLASLTSKIMATLFLNRIPPALNEHLQEEPHGCQPNRSDVDLGIYSLNAARRNE